MHMLSRVVGAILALALVLGLEASAQINGPSPGGSASSPLFVTGTGTAGTAAPGVLAVQGIAGATPIPISGTITDSNPVGITPTDHTITSASGASQQIMAANASRHSLTIQDTGNANCGVNPTGGTALIGGAGTLTLLPGGSYTPRVPTLSAITVICTAAQPIYGDDN